MLGSVDTLRWHLAHQRIRYNTLSKWSIAEERPLVLASYVSIALAVVLFFHVINTRRRPESAPSQSRGKSSLKPPERPLGVWTPVDFKRPAAAPYPDWDVKSTKPLPYRPFRWGPYHITMGLRTMKWDEWIELDNDYLKFHNKKAERIEERGAKCCRTAPEAFDGACELLEEL